jgi:hypothetical protein
MPLIDTHGRHQATKDAARWLEPNPNLPPEARDIATHCGELAARMLAKLPDSAELTLALRTLTEAKNLFVQAAIGSEGGQQGWAALRA